MKSVKQIFPTCRYLTYHYLSSQYLHSEEVVHIDADWDMFLEKEVDEEHAYPSGQEHVQSPNAGLDEL